MAIIPGIEFDTKVNHFILTKPHRQSEPRP